MFKTIIKILCITCSFAFCSRLPVKRASNIKPTQKQVVQPKQDTPAPQQKIQMIKKIVIDPTEVEHVARGDRKLVIFGRTVWYNLSPGVLFAPPVIYWIISLVAALILIIWSVIPIIMFLTAFTLYKFLPWLGAPSSLMQFLLAPWFIALLFIAGLSLMVWLIFRNAPTPTTQISTEFSNALEALPQDQQDAVSGFKSRSFSFMLNGAHTGAIISNLTINSRAVGVQIVFDNQSVLYLSFSEIFDADRALGVYRMTVPVRSLSGSTVLDSLTQSYSIALDKIMSNFNITTMTS